MIQQRDVDDLLNDLQAMRSALLRDRASVAGRLDALLDRARALHGESVGGRFEPALASVHDLLKSLKRGVDAQAQLDALR